MPRNLCLGIAFWIALTSVAPASDAAAPEPASAPSAAGADSGCRRIATAAELGIPYDRYQVRDALGRDIIFYVSVESRAREASLPIALCIQGSGCASLFRRNADGRIGGGWQNLMRSAAAGRMRIVAAEKPGVQYLDNPERPGTALHCSEAYQEEQALERWREGLHAVLRAALALPGTDRNRLLLVGRSEGGIMAAALAAAEPAVTHVAVLASNGPSQVFDMAEAVRHEALAGGGSAAAAQESVEAVYRTFTRIFADPQSTTRFAWDHAYRRWSTFCSHSTLDFLLQTPARIYLAHGTEDTSVPVSSAELLRAELVRRGREVTVEFIPGADHAFRVPDSKDPAGLQPVVLAHVAEWFLQPRP